MDGNKRVAVICLPHLARTLQSNGFTVVGGSDDFIQDANAARQDVAVNGPLPLLVSARPVPGMRPFLSRQVTGGTEVTLVAVPGEERIDVPGTTLVELPTELDEVLAEANLPLIGGGPGATKIMADGTLEPGAAPAGPDPVRSDDPWESPAPGAAPQADIRPVEPAPPAPPEAWESTAPVPSPTRVTRAPWGQAPGAAAPLPVQPSAPAHGRDPWETAHVPPAPHRPVPAADPWANAEPVVPAGGYVPSPPPGSSRYADLVAPVREEEVEDVFTPRTAATPAVSERRRTNGAVVCCVAGKGGVGKSSTVIELAWLAAEKGIKACVVDANRGQGDQRKFLRVPTTAGLPSVYDAAVGTLAYEDVILTPERLNQSRPSMADPLPFSVIMAPPKELADPDVVTSDVYARAIQTAAATHDLVLVDTQIIEATDTSGLIDGMVIPLLRSGAWAVGLADDSSPGIDNLRERLLAFRAAGVPRDRIMVVFDKINPDMDVRDETAQRVFAQSGQYAGTVFLDPRIDAALKAGQSTSSIPELAKVLTGILFRVTGRPDLDPAHLVEPPRPRNRFSFRRRR